MIKAFEGGGFGGLDINQSRPFGQEIQCHFCTEVLTDQFQSLRKVIFESADELIEQEGAAVDGFAPGLDQVCQRAGSLIIELERAQTLAVMLAARKAKPRRQANHQHRRKGETWFGAECWWRGGSDRS